MQGGVLASAPYAPPDAIFIRGRNFLLNFRGDIFGEGHMLPLFHTPLISAFFAYDSLMFLMLKSSFFFNFKEMVGLNIQIMVLCVFSEGKRGGGWRIEKGKIIQEIQ